MREECFRLIEIKRNLNFKFSNIIIKQMNDDKKVVRLIIDRKMIIVINERQCLRVLLVLKNIIINALLLCDLPCAFRCGRSHRGVMILYFVVVVVLCGVNKPKII
jgi:hypothetical protein